MVEKYAPRRREHNNYLDGTACLQIESNACQELGACFLEFERKNFREYMGTS